ncbi:MAG: glycoside hydrolase family 1 protein [bacterium]|nr:glycoside hydrolase family 1 protein [bacterium]
MKFFWGAATSAHQVEGGNHNDWSEFEIERKLEQSGRAAEHYRLYKDDFDLAQELGHNAHRFSIEWSRIEPREGEFDEVALEHYKNVVAALHERNLEPFVTLWHWTVPTWFRDKGGWTADTAVDDFLRFVERVIGVIPNVRFWVTLNEPNVYTIHGYYNADWPPGKKSIRNLIKANFNLVKAHKQAYQFIHAHLPAVQVGITQNLIYFSKSKLKDYFWNHWFFRRIHDSQDFVGVNYYFSDRETGDKTDMGWSIDPEGFREVLMGVTEYQKPVYVLENGIADEKDEKRGKYIRDHITQMLVAKDSGIDLRGYFYWSLLDNFEWAHGFSKRFGLIEVDYVTMERRIRKSSYVYKELLEAHNEDS